MSNATVSHLQNASEHLGLARDHLVVGAADAAQSTVDAMREMKAEAGEDLDVLIDQGRTLVNRAGSTLGQRPWLAIGGALAVGYLLARLSRRG